PEPCSGWSAWAPAAGHGWARPLAPVDPDQAYRPFLQPHVRLVWIQVAVLVAIAVLALSVLAGRGRRRGLAGLAGAALLAGAVIALSGTDPAPTEIRAAPADPACATGTMSVCLWPENADLLPAARALATAPAAFAPYLPVPVRFSEPGIDRRATAGPGIFVPPPDPGDRLAFQAAALTAIMPPPCPAELADARVAMSYGDLVTWAEARVGGQAGVLPYAGAGRPHPPRGPGPAAGPGQPPAGGALCRRTRRCRRRW
ncbi:MAG: hypothetical protein ABJB47_23405, partial [Actinomycetota bacterium]